MEDDVTFHPDAKEIINMMEIFIYTRDGINNKDINFQFLKGTHKFTITGS